MQKAQTRLFSFCQDTDHKSFAYLFANMTGDLSRNRHSVIFGIKAYNKHGHDNFSDDEYGGSHCPTAVGDADISFEI